jgi:hypothetical protein
MLYHQGNSSQSWPGRGGGCLNILCFSFVYLLEFEARASRIDIGLMIPPRGGGGGYPGGGGGG